MGKYRFIENLHRMVDLNHDNLEILMDKDELGELISAIRNVPDGGLFTEWGSGGSTIALLEHRRDTQRVISIEHNKNWYDNVNELTEKYFPDITEKDFKFLYQPCLMKNYVITYAIPDEENPVGFDDYMIPDEEVLYSDVCFIDGIARAATALTQWAFSRNPNAVFYLHDYAGRELWYDWFMKNVQHKKRIGKTLIKFSKSELLD